QPDAPGRSLLAAEAAPAPLQAGGPAPARATAGAPAPRQGARAVTLRISPYSRRENDAAASLLGAAAQAYREGKPLEARAMLEDLRKRYSWRQADLARAEEVQKSWDAEAE